MPKLHYLIVGGTRGIGLVLASRLCEDPDNLVSVLGRTPSAKLISSAQATQYAVDVSDRDALLSVLDQAVANYGRISYAIFMQRNRERGSNSTRLDLDVGLCATVDSIEHLIAHDSFVDSSASVSPGIVLISSVADRYVAPEQPVGYHLAKAGVSQMTRYYALKLGGKGIRVNSVSPCVVMKNEAKDYYAAHKSIVLRYQQSIPLQRMGMPEDISNVIMFFCSEQASYVTGQNIVVDGGLTLLSHESLIRDLPLDAE